MLQFTADLHILPAVDLEILPAEGFFQVDDEMKTVAGEDGDDIFGG